MTLVMGIPASILQLVQQGLLERAFHDALFPSLLFRAEAQSEEWEANTGVELYMTRPGLLAPVTKATPAGTDPTPQVLSYEQWVARLDRYSGTVDTYMPTSAVSNSDQFLRNIQQLGMQAGQSMNRIPRNVLYSSYLSGQTNLIVVTAAVDVTLRVASVNGFVDVLVKGTTVRPTPVSSSNPLAITIMNGATPIVRNVIGVDLDNPDDPMGPGTLFLSAAVGAIVPVRSPVLSGSKPRVIRAGGGNSVDAIGTSDISQIQDYLQAASWLRKNNVPPHEDGTYHVHINTDANEQLFTDPAWQRLNQGRGAGEEAYQNGFIGRLYGCSFFLNNECPESGNSGARTLTGTNAAYSEDIGAETTNEAGVNIGRVLVTGRGSLYEKWLNESAYVSEAGVTGKIAEFQTVNAGVEVKTENIRLIIRAPLNRLQDMVSASWSITTSFAVPSDITTNGVERFKRAVVVEHALNS